MKYYISVFLMVVSVLVMAENDGSYLSESKQVDANIWIGPQPSVNDINEFAAEEITVVINTRTQAEMEQLDFTESDELKKLDIAYGLVEIGQGHDYSPDKLAAFNELMTAHGGEKMVLHCRSGHRASQLYAAWLVKYQGKSEKEALQAIQSDESELSDSMKALLGQ